MDHALDVHTIDRTIEEVAQLYRQMTGQPIEARKLNDLPPEKDPVAFVGERLGRLHTLLRERISTTGPLGDWTAPPPVAPPIDVLETETAIVVSIDLPGVQRDELSLTVVNDVLLVSAERRLDRTAAAGMPRLQERAGRYQRAVPMPQRVRNEPVDAELKDGVLTVRLDREAPSVWPPKA